MGDKVTHKSKQKVQPHSKLGRWLGIPSTSLGCPRNEVPASSEIVIISNLCKMSLFITTTCRRRVVSVLREFAVLPWPHFWVGIWGDVLSLIKFWHGLGGRVLRTKILQWCGIVDEFSLSYTSLSASKFAPAAPKRSGTEQATGTSLISKRRREKLIQYGVLGYASWQFLFPTLNRIRGNETTSDARSKAPRDFC